MQDLDNSLAILRSKTVKMSNKTLKKTSTKPAPKAHKKASNKAKKPASPTKTTSKASTAPVAHRKPGQNTKPQKPTKHEFQVPSHIYKGHFQCLKTARHFGFAPFGLEVEKQDITKVKSLKDKSLKGDSAEILTFDAFLEEKVAVLRNYIDKKMQDLNQPPAICFSGPLKGNTFADKAKHNSSGHVFNIDIIGNSKSVADAVVIETAFVILKEHNPDMELMVEINSVGDKDSFARFAKEFAAYYKKHLGELPADLRQIYKKDPLLLATSQDDRLAPWSEEAPKTVNYLSEESRTHFREVLEFMESLGLPYMINETLTGSRNCSTGTVFQIIGIEESSKEKEKRSLLAIGERYNSIARKAFGKKEIPAIGAHILVDDKDSKKSDSIIIEEDTRFYFIHLGYEAKLKSLTILEMLRTAKIPVHQALAKDKITAQLQGAEKMGVPYILLVGQKEALENSVTVRHVETRVQETVHIDALIEYLRKL
jgi:histidyl-tRNA synthetase